MSARFFKRCDLATVSKRDRAGKAHGGQL